MISEDSLSPMVVGGLNANRIRKGGGGGGRRNVRSRNMGEGPGVILERELGGVGGYDFEGSGGERRSLCVEGDRVGDQRIGWEGGDGVGKIIIQSCIQTHRDGA